MIFHFIIQAIFLLTGLTALLASVFNWEWFFSTQSARTYLRRQKRGKLRLFYGILGLILILTAFYFFHETLKAFS